MFVGNIKNLRHVSQAFAGKRSKELFSPLDLTKKHHNLKEAAYKFTDEEIITKAAHYDQTVEFPWDIIKKAHANGFMNSEIPVEYGGLALDLLSNVLISEAIGYGCTGIGNAILSNELAATPIIIGGSAEIKKKYLGLLINEPVMASYCVTERGAGSDVAGLNAVKQGKDWVINGSKMWITNGGVASWFFVLARTAPDPKVPNEKAFTAFVVDGDAKGLSRGKKEINLGHRCFDTRGITFEHVVVPSSNVIGIPGEGFKIAMKTFDKTRPIVAALAVGLASRALDEAAKYSFETKTFEPPIANNQLISFLLADMAMSLEHSRLMTYKIAQEVDLGRPGAYWASLAKCFAAAAANQTLSNVDMILGGNGFNTELQVEKLLQDLKFFRKYHHIILPEDYNTDIEKIQIEGKTFPITFPFRRIDMVVSSDDKKHLATLFEKKVYKNATELLDSAKGYMIAGEECLASEQAWGAYSCAVKHLYKDMQLFISNHEAIEAMSFLASNFYSGEFDFIQAYANANNSHKNFYNGDEKTEVVWLYIRTVENFIKAFSTIDSKIVCASLQEYLPMDYREGKSFGKFMIKKMPKHTKKSIYGVEFVFKYNVGYKN